MTDPLRRVLLVEDDEDDALLVADLLETWPEVELTVVPSAADAAPLVRDADCVLLDLGLPDADGLQALHRVLEADEDAPVVVLTGDPDGRRGAEAVAAGAQDYLVKGSADGAALMRAMHYAVERRTHERTRQQLAVARTVAEQNARLQRGLLPAPVVRNAPVAVATAYRPGLRRQLLGGDFFDVVEDAAGRLHAIIADVAGHGPDEAALGVRLRIAWRSLVLGGTPVETVLDILEDVLVHEREHDDVFVTAAQVTLAPAGAEAELRLAGHPAPVLFGDEGGPELVADCRPGPALGLRPLSGTRGEPCTVVLPAAWRLLFYTDGLYEGRRNGAGERLGLDALLEEIRAWAPSGAELDDAALTGLVDRVEARNGGPLGDDVALLSLRPSAAA